MSKDLEINIEIGLCTKDMAKENPIKDFEILIEEYKDKWSKQMYDYFKECLSIIEKELKEYEEMKRIKGTTTLDSALEETLIKACPNVAKKVKALESIKVILKDLIEFNEIDLPHIDKVIYEIKICDKAIYTSKEKYDLLKEVLL